MKTLVDNTVFAIYQNGQIHDGLHWPDLDEDLSFKGLLEDDFGQYVKFRKKDK